MKQKQNSMRIMDDGDRHDGLTAAPPVARQLPSPLRHSRSTLQAMKPLIDGGMMVMSEAPLPSHQRHPPTPVPSPLPPALRRAHRTLQAMKPPIEAGIIAASPAPASIRSASPRRMWSAAFWMQ
eukprot:363696-Chlamydomonas_euryale.AAC.15